MSDAKTNMGAQSSNQLKTRLSKALFKLNLKLASCKSGALVQVWMPEICADGSVVLSAQGLPFAIAGVGDLLALFRCVSCRYRFTTDITRPALMGAIGRVYSSCEPEMSHNVQKYDKQVYLRVSEAQRCRVHSTLVMPVFDAGDDGAGGRPIAVFELVQADRDVAFPAVIAELRKCLLEVAMSTSEPDSITTSVGLRKWPLHIESAALLRELGEELGGPQPQHSLTNSAGRLLLENDAPDDETSPAGPTGVPANGGAAAAAGNPGAVPASSFVSAWVQQAPGGAAARAAGSPGTLPAGAGGSGAAAVKPEPGSGSGTPGSGQGSAEAAGSGQASEGGAAAAAAAAPGARQATRGAGRARGGAAGAAAGPAGAGADDMMVDSVAAGSKHAAQSASVGEEGGGDTDEAQSKQSLPAAAAAAAGKAQQQQQQQQPAQQQQAAQPAKDSSNPVVAASTQQQLQQQQQAPLDLNGLLVSSMQALLNQHTQALQASSQPQQQQQGSGSGAQQQQQLPDQAALSSAISTLIAAANSQQGGNSNQQQPLLASLQQLQMLQQQLLAGQQQQQQQQGGQNDAGSMPANQQQQQHLQVVAMQLQALSGMPRQQQQQQQQQMQQLQQQQQLLMLQQQHQQTFMQPPQQLRRNNSSMASLARPAATVGACEEGEEEEEELLGSDDDEEGGGRGHSQRNSAANRPMGTGRKLTFEDLQAQFGLGLKEAAANLGICATTLKRACRRNGITRWPRRQIQKLNRALTQMGPGQAISAPLDELVHSAIKKNLKPSMLTPAVTASLQQHLMVPAGQGQGQGGYQQRSSSVAIPRAGSGPTRHGGSNSGSFTGCGGSLGDAVTLAGAGCGSAGQQLGAFAGFSFPGADGQLTSGLAGGCGDGSVLHQQQLMAGYDHQQHLPGAPGLMMLGGGGAVVGGSYQALLGGGGTGAPDLQHHHSQLMLQQQAVLASSQQQLMLLQHQQQTHQQQMNTAALGALPGISQQQQQQQMLMRTEQQQSLVAAAAGSPGSSTPPGAAPGLAAEGSGALLGSPAGSSAAAAMTVVAPSIPASRPTPSHVTDSSSMAARQHGQGQQLLQGLEAPGEGFFDLLSDDMLLDDAGLDLASFEGAVGAGGPGGAAGGGPAASAGGPSDYDPAKEFRGFF